MINENSKYKNKFIILKFLFQCNLSKGNPLCSIQYTKNTLTFYNTKNRLIRSIKKSYL